MSEWVVNAIANDRHREYLRFVLPEWRELAEEPKTELLAAIDEKGIPCGALLADMNEGRYEIVSLFVEEDKRRQGAASSLLEQAERSAAAYGYGTVDLSYSAEAGEEEMMHRFFLVRGYALPRRGSVLYTVEVKTLEKSKIAALPPVQERMKQNIFPLDKLPFMAAKTFASYMGKEIPAALAPQRAPGDPLPEYSAAYVEDEKVVSFVVFSRVGQSLYMHAAYLAAGHNRAFAALLRRSYDLLAADSTQFQTFCVNAINDTAQRLTEGLLVGAEVDQRQVFYTQKPLVDQTPTPTNWGGILARSNALVRAMADSGFGSSLCMEPGVLPYILWTPYEKMEISVFYDVEDEEYTQFTLSAQMLLSPIKPQRAEYLIKKMQEDPGPGLLIPSDQEDTYALFATQQEGEQFEPEKSIEGFLKAFLVQAKRLVETQ